MLATKLNIGDIVTVYTDPCTKQNPEGPADLREFLGNDDGFEEWLVHFIGDHPGETYQRFVDPTDLLSS